MLVSAQQVFQKRYDRGGINNRAYASAFDSTGYYLAGTTQGSVNPTWGSPLVTKFDLDGNELWSKTFEGVQGGYAADIIINKWGNVVIVGETDIDYNDFNAFLLELNPSGTMVNQVVWTGNNRTGIEKIKQFPNGNYLLGGWEEGSVLTWDGFIAVVDSSFALQWIRSSEYVDNITDLLIDYENNIFFTADFYEDVNDYYYSYLGKMNDQGNVLWGKTQISIDNDRFIALAQHQDSSIFVSYAKDYYLSNSTNHLFKYDRNGTMLWQKHILVVSNPYSIYAMTKRAGRDEYLGLQISGVIFCLDGAGNLLWNTKTAPGNGRSIRSMNELPNRQLQVAGYVNTSADLFLGVYDSLGSGFCNVSSPTVVIGTSTISISSGGIAFQSPSISPSIGMLPYNAPLTQTLMCSSLVSDEEIELHEKLISVFPNPFQNEFQIQFPDDEKFENCNAIIYDSFGRIVMKEHIINSEENNKINMSQISSGIYILEIKNKTGVKKIFRIVKI